MVTFRKWQATSVGESLEILVSLNTAGGNVKWLSQCRRMVPPRVINRITMCSSNFTSTKHTHTHALPPPKRNGTSTQNACAHTHIYTTKRYKTTQMPIKGWMDKQTVVHTHSRTLFSQKKNKALIKVTTWVSPEDTVLSEGSRTLEPAH